MEVKVEHRHTINSSYIDITGCPLFKAIKEQYPKFPLESVAGTYISTNSGIFSIDGDTWGYPQYLLLQKRKIDSVSVVIKDVPDHHQSI